MKNIVSSILILAISLYSGSLNTYTCPENNQPIPFGGLTPQEVSFYRNTCHYVVDFTTGNLVHSSKYKVQAL